MLFERDETSSKESISHPNHFTNNNILEAASSSMEEEKKIQNHDRLDNSEQVERVGIDHDESNSESESDESESESDQPMCFNPHKYFANVSESDEDCSNFDESDNDQQSQSYSDSDFDSDESNSYESINVGESFESNNEDDEDKETTDPVNSLLEVNEKGLPSENVVISNTAMPSHKSTTLKNSGEIRRSNSSNQINSGEIRKSTSSDQISIPGEPGLLSDSDSIDTESTSMDGDDVQLETIRTEREKIEENDETTKDESEDEVVSSTVMPSRRSNTTKNSGEIRRSTSSDQIYSGEIRRKPSLDQIPISGEPKPIPDSDCIDAVSTSMDEDNTQLETISTEKETIEKIDETTETSKGEFKEHGENEKMALPNQLRPLNSNIDVTDYKKDAIPSCNKDNSTHWKDDVILKQQMEAAMLAHQKNKAILRKQSRDVERSKHLTNRERIQAAMRNLGQPMPSTSMPKSRSRSSVESDERSSDMVQRFAVFANVDSDDEMTTGEESEITEHIRNTHRPTPQSYKDLQTNNKVKKSSLLSRFRLTKKDLPPLGTQKVHSENEYQRVEVDENDENDKVNKNSSFAQHHEVDIPLATEIVHAVNDKPSLSSNISGLTWDQESARGNFSRIENDVLCPPNRSDEIKRKGPNPHPRKSPIIILGIILAIGLGCISVLIIVRERNQNKLNQIDTESSAPMDNNLSAPMILSESFIQTFYGIDLSPMEPSQVTIWEAVLEDIASGLVTPNKNTKTIVSTRCMINYQIHEGSVIWSRNRKRKHDENKESLDQDGVHNNVGRNIRSLLHIEDDTMNRHLSTTNITDENQSREDSNSIKIDFTLTFSTISADVDLNDYLTMFLETMNSNKGKENILLVLQTRQGMAVERTDNIYFRDENGAALFLRTFPTASPFSEASLQSRSSFSQIPTSYSESYIPSHASGESARIPHWDWQNLIFHNFNCTSECCLGLYSIPCQFDVCYCDDLP